MDHIWGVTKQVRFTISASIMVHVKIWRFVCLIVYLLVCDPCLWISNPIKVLILWYGILSYSLGDGLLGYISVMHSHMARAKCWLKAHHLAVLDCCSIQIATRTFSSVLIESVRFVAYWLMGIFISGSILSLCIKKTDHSLCCCTELKN